MRNAVNTHETTQKMLDMSADKSWPECSSTSLPKTPVETPGKTVWKASEETSEKIQ